MKTTPPFLVLSLLAALASTAFAQNATTPATPPASLGLFDASADIGLSYLPGNIARFTEPGSAQYDDAKKTYTITGDGENIGGASDSFTYAYKKVQGDILLETTPVWGRAPQNPTRPSYSQAGVMLRQNLDFGSPFADVVVDGDGHIAFQYRLYPNGPTQEVTTTIKAPVTIRLERNGATANAGAVADVITASVQRPGGQFQEIGALTIPLGNDVYAGLALAAPNPYAPSTAVFSNVTLDAHVVTGARVRETTLEVLDLDTLERHTIFRENNTFEAPNWTHDGAKLLINRQAPRAAAGGGGSGQAPRGGALTLLYTLPIINTTFPLTAANLTQIPTGNVTQINNDHSFSFDGQWLAISARDPVSMSSKVYVLPAEGGQPRQVTYASPGEKTTASYLHGWSPDGKTLVFCGQRDTDPLGDIYSIAADGSGKEVRLTTAPGLDDGPEYSPDGQYIYFNSVRSGNMKIWRMKPDGSAQTMVSDPDPTYNDWFAHISPDGKSLVMISFLVNIDADPAAQAARAAAGLFPVHQGLPAGKHDADQSVVLRQLPTDAPAGAKPKIIATLYGGQGTINTPSWSPDSKHLAFVSYRYVGVAR